MTKLSPEDREALIAVLRADKARAAGDYIPHKPTKKQAQFLALDCLEALYGGAAGGGKSDALLMAALEYVHVPGYAALLLRRRYTDLALPGAIMDRAHEWLGQSNAKWDDREKTWHFPSGATLTFGYLDAARDHFRYQGAEFQFVGYDELTQFLEQQYLYLFSRLRKLKGSDVPIRMRAATNPGDIGHEWVKARFIAPDAEKSRVFVSAKLDDNPHLDHGEYERALSQLDSTTRSQLREGLWIRDLSMLVYHLDDGNMVEDLPPLQGDAQWHHVLGIDYGNVDATALVVLAFNAHDPHVYVRESQAWEHLTPSDAADIVKTWRDRYEGGFQRIVADVGGLGKGYAEEAKKRHKLPIVAAAKQNKLGYIKLLNGDLEGRKLLVVRGGNEQLATEMRALAWKDTWQEAEHPEMDNHLCDATLYAWREARHWLSTDAPNETPKTPEQITAARNEAYKRRIARDLKERKDKPWWDRK